MRNKIFLFLIMTIIILPVLAFAQNITITQIDPSALLLRSTIDAYASVTDAEGEPIINADYSLFKAEHEASQGMKPAKIINIAKNGSTSSKITFLLVLDNSGSMYKPVRKGSKETRMDHAKRAVRNFLKEIENSGVRVGLAVFNTRYSLIIEPSSDIGPVIEALSGIKKPDNKNAFTELYYGIYRSAYEMSRFRGRKAIILLSDGQNYPYYKKTGKPNPEIGVKIYTPEDSLNSLQKEGATLYGINFSPYKDPSLSLISIGSGGTIYDAVNSSQLLNVYKKIQDRIAEEYRITIKAPLTFLETPEVKVWYGDSSSTQSYYSPPLMGSPSNKNLLFFVLIFALAFIVWTLLVLVRFERPAKRPEISMIKRGAGKPVQRTIVLSSQKTVIGSSSKDDFTIAGNPKIKGSHAEIIKDKKTGVFTIVSDKEVKVNNQPTKKRKLRPGDVINIEGTTIVFDAPEEKR